MTITTYIRHNASRRGQGGRLSPLSRTETDRIGALGIITFGVLFLLWFLPVDAARAASAEAHASAAATGTGTGSTITCYKVRHDAESLPAFARIVESGYYSSDDAPWVGGEDSTVVNVGIWLHDVAHGVPNPTFVADSFPVC